MEFRAPHALVGAFMLAAIAGIFGFVYWLNNTGSLSARTLYEVRFENPVLGLLTGSSVMFNGIRVGEITKLRLEPSRPRQVTAIIAVEPATPVRADTEVDIDFQGLAGVAVIALTGGGRPFGSLPPGELQVLVAKAGVGQSMTQAARITLQRLDTILGENSEPLRGVVGNFNTFSAALARNSGRLDGILAGIERMTGGPAEKPIAVVYDLLAPQDFPGIHKAPHGQIAVAELTAVLAFDTQRILVRPAGPETPTFAGTQWSDSLPKLLQAKIIQSLENANFPVSRPGEGLTPKHQLLVDLRAFHVSIAAEPTALIEFSGKVVDGNGKIVETRLFSASATIATLDAPGAAAALNEAFGKAAKELVVWLSRVT